MRRTVVVVLLAVVASLVVPAAPAAADTTVDPNGSDVTITIKIDVFAGENLRTGPDGQPIDTYFRTVLENTWGQAFNNVPYKNCYRFKLDLDLKLFDVNDKGRKGSHKLYVGSETRGWKGVGWDGAPKETSRDGDTGDGTRSFENDRKGDIPANAPPTVVAHEFGHLFGLGDDRENGAPKPGYDLDDVMVGGVPGVDLNQTPVIGKKVIDRIGEVIEQSLKDQGKRLPKCQTWKGTLNGFGDNVGICENATMHSGDFTIGVVGDSALFTGHMKNEAGGGCNTAGRPETTEADFTLVGEKTRRAFSFPDASNYNFPFAVELEIAGDHATGSTTANPGGGGIYFVTLDFEADCTKNCDDEPVG